MRRDEASRKRGGEETAKEAEAEIDHSRRAAEATGAAAGTKLSVTIGFTGDAGLTAMKFSMDAADDVQQSAAFMLGPQSCWPSSQQAISALFVMLSGRQFAKAEVATARTSMPASAMRRTRDISSDCLFRGHGCQTTDSTPLFPLGFCNVSSRHGTTIHGQVIRVAGWYPLLGFSGLLLNGCSRFAGQNPVGDGQSSAIVRSTSTAHDGQRSVFFPAFFAAAHRAFADADSFARRALEKRRLTFFTVFVISGRSFLAC